MGIDCSTNAVSFALAGDQPFVSSGDASELLSWLD